MRYYISRLVCALAPSPPQPLVIRNGPVVFLILSPHIFESVGRSFLSSKIFLKCVIIYCCNSRYCFIEMRIVFYESL